LPGNLEAEVIFMREKHAIILPGRSWPILSGILLALTLASCLSPPGVSVQNSAVETLAKPLPTRSEESFDFAMKAGWLTVADLKPFLPALRQLAEIDGYTADWVQPDPQTGQSFLVAAADAPAANQLNGFFYWFHDPRHTDESRSPLLLVIDRLFSEASREAAMAAENCSDPRVVNLLDHSLRQILGISYQQDILTFILHCYRQAFADRRESTEAKPQVWRQTFNRIEVTYESAYSNTIIFRILPVST
jgi:hypothetical protein